MGGNLLKSGENREEEKNREEQISQLAKNTIQYNKIFHLLILLACSHKSPIQYPKNMEFNKKQSTSTNICCPVFIYKVKNKFLVICVFRVSTAPQSSGEFVQIALMTFRAAVLSNLP